MYGQHLALNHLIGAKQLSLIKLEDLIDYPSANDESIFKKLHVHVFHGDDMFSKFAFKIGKYDRMNVSNDDKNIDKIRYYALKMALDGKRIKPNELYNMLKQETQIKI